MNLDNNLQCECHWSHKMGMWTKLSSVNVQRNALEQHQPKIKSFLYPKLKPWDMDLDNYLHCECHWSYKMGMWTKLSSVNVQRNALEQYQPKIKSFLYPKLKSWNMDLDNNLHRESNPIKRVTFQMNATDRIRWVWTNLSSVNVQRNALEQYQLYYHAWGTDYAAQDVSLNESLVWPFKREQLSNTFLCYHLLYCTRQFRSTCLCRQML